MRFWQKAGKKQELTKSKKGGIICHKFQEGLSNKQSNLERMVIRMNEKVIKLADVEEVCDFVRAAGMCDFDIDISDQRMVIDAKSILGVMGLGIKKELTVKYGGEDITFENVLNKYTVA